MRRGTGRALDRPRRTAKLPDALRRTHKLNLYLRPHEGRDLDVIAKAWGVPAATVAWVLVHEALARIREQAPDYGGGRDGVGLAAAIAARVIPEPAGRLAAAQRAAPSRACEE